MNAPKRKRKEKEKKKKNNTGYLHLLPVCLTDYGLLRKWMGPRQLLVNCIPGGGNIHSANVNLCGVWLREQTSRQMVLENPSCGCLVSLFVTRGLIRFV